MIAGSSRLKVCGYPLALGMPLLAPIGVGLEMPWLAPLVVFGLFPIIGLIVGEDRSLPLVGLRKSRWLVAYLDWLPRLYAVVWIGAVVWALRYAGIVAPGAAAMASLIIAVGIGSAVAICTAHELMHRQSRADVSLGRLMSIFCLYGHMYVEHLHHHATMGDVAAGETAPRGMSIYRFAPADFVHGLRNAWKVEGTRLRRERRSFWHNRLVQDYGGALLVVLGTAVLLGWSGAVLLVGQAVFAIYCFEVITYVHHYGLVRAEGEEPGPHHAWAHHCWLTNCLTFNNTFHSDHHLRPRTPYYELHAMYGAPKLPASYFTMFCVALAPPLWRRLMDRRLDALQRSLTQGRVAAELQSHQCA